MVKIAPRSPTRRLADPTVQPSIVRLKTTHHRSSTAQIQRAKAPAKKNATRPPASKNKRQIRLAQGTSVIRHALPWDQDHVPQAIVPRQSVLVAFADQLSAHFLSRSALKISVNQKVAQSIALALTVPRPIPLSVQSTPDVSQLRPA